MVQKSGRLGLGEFLPPNHRIKYAGAGAKGRVVQDMDPFSNPSLPLSKTPGETSFALNDVLSSWGTIRVRDWILRAMERYRFVIGTFYRHATNYLLLIAYFSAWLLFLATTPADFAMLQTPLSAKRLFRKIDADDHIALLTINDDVTIKEQEVDRIFRNFLNRRWGFPSSWEA